MLRFARSCALSRRADPTGPPDRTPSPTAQELLDEPRHAHRGGPGRPGQPARGRGRGVRRLQKTVVLSVDGEQRTIHTYARTVGDVLEHEKLDGRRARHRRARARATRRSTGELRLDAPRPRARAQHRRQRPVRCGPPRRTSTRRSASSACTPPTRTCRCRARAASRSQGVDVTVRTPHRVTVLVDGKRITHTSTAATVARPAARGAASRSARATSSSPATDRVPARRRHRSPWRASPASGSSQQVADPVQDGPPRRPDHVRGRPRASSAPGEPGLVVQDVRRHLRRRQGRRAQARSRSQAQGEAGHARSCAYGTRKAPPPAGGVLGCPSTGGAELGGARALRVRRPPARGRRRRAVLRALPVRPRHVARSSAARAARSTRRRASRPRARSCSTRPRARSRGRSAAATCDRARVTELHARDAAPDRATPRLLGAADVRALAAELGVRPTKTARPELRPRRQHRAPHRAGRRASGRDDVVRRGRARARLADARPARRRRAASSPSRSTRCSPRRCRAPSPSARPTLADRLEVVHADALRGRRRCPARRRPRWSRTCRTTSRCRCCCTCSRRCRRCSACW